MPNPIIASQISRMPGYITAQQINPRTSLGYSDYCKMTSNPDDKTFRIRFDTDYGAYDLNNSDFDDARKNQLANVCCYYYNNVKSRGTELINFIKRDIDKWDSGPQSPSSCPIPRETQTLGVTSSGNASPTATQVEKQKMQCTNKGTIIDFGNNVTYSQTGNNANKVVNDLVILCNNRKSLFNTSDDLKKSTLALYNANINACSLVSQYGDNYSFKYGNNITANYNGSKLNNRKTVCQNNWINGVEQNLYDLTVKNV